MPLALNCMVSAPFPEGEDVRIIRAPRPELVPLNEESFE